MSLEKLLLICGGNSNRMPWKKSGCQMWGITGPGGLVCLLVLRSALWSVKLRGCQETTQAKHFISVGCGAGVLLQTQRSISSKVDLWVEAETIQSLRFNLFSLGITVSASLHATCIAVPFKSILDYLCGWCPWRSKEKAGSPGTGATDG